MLYDLLRKINRKYLVLAVIILALIIAGVWLINYLSYRSVSVTLPSNISAVTIYRGSSSDYSAGDPKLSNQKVIRITTSSTISLQDGNYFAVPEGEKTDVLPIEFSINSESNDVNFNPYYSQLTLSSLLSGEVGSQLLSTVHTKYTNIIINNSALYHFGDWGGVSIQTIPGRGDSPDHYGVILHKINDKWQIAATPELVFCYDDHKDIPKDIINSVNRLVNQ